MHSEKIISKKEIRCPKCNSKRINKLSYNRSFCMECDIEFDKNNLTMFLINEDGTLLKLVK